MELLESKTVADVPDDSLQGEAVAAPPRKKRRGAATFLFPSPGEGPIDDECEDGVILLEARVTLELSYYEKEKGCDLYDSDGNFLCPLCLPAFGYLLRRFFPFQLYLPLPNEF